MIRALVSSSHHQPAAPQAKPINQKATALASFLLPLPASIAMPTANKANESPASTTAACQKGDEIHQPPNASNDPKIPLAIGTPH